MQQSAASNAAALAVAGVSHRFASVEALRDVSLTVPQGSFCALLGVNGAGKSTLFSLITRLYDRTSGRIEVAGFDARHASRPHRTLVDPADQQAWPAAQPDDQAHWKL